MKLQHLRFFVAAVECGGVVKAAERLRMSQPAVSAGLKALEQELGQPLFERKDRAPRGVRPTSKARDFYQDAVDILRRCDAAAVQFRRTTVQPVTLRIGVLNTISSRHITEFLCRLASIRPDVQVRAREGGPVQLQQWLRGEQLDAIWSVVDKTKKNARPWLRERFVLLVGPGHRLARGRRDLPSWSDLAREPFVLRGACEAPRGKLWPPSFRIRVVARAERDDLALSLVAAGVGIAVAPESLATNDIVTRQISGLDVTRSIGLRWRPDLEQSTLDAILNALPAAPANVTTRGASLM